jgi:hypothetical protein
MSKSIILYNLREGVTDEDYGKWCEEYKGPLFLSLPACKSFTLVRILGGAKGDGVKGAPPEGSPSPYRYVGIVDVENLEAWQKDTESKVFREDFFSRWFSTWVSDFYILAGQEVYRGENRP